MKKTKQFLWDTAVLTIAALFMRTVGVSFNVYLTNQLGAAGIGLFQLVMTVFSMAITFASSGIRLAATRLVVDAISKDRADVKKVLRRCLLSILLVAVVVALILYTGSDLISQHWLYDSRTAQPLRLLSLSLPFIAMSAALSGYFTAIRRQVFMRAYKFWSSLCGLPPRQAFCICFPAAAWRPPVSQLYWAAAFRISSRSWPRFS